MADETITEEQKRVKRIIKRWRQVKTSLRLFSILLILFFFYAMKLPYAWAPWIYTLLIGTYCIYRYLWRKFLRSLSAEDVAVLKKETRTLPNRQYRSIVHIIWTYEESVVSAKMSLLRASTEPQNETLLRAAAHTDTTPQEQLLRPSTDE